MNFGMRAEIRLSFSCQFSTKLISNLKWHLKSESFSSKLYAQINVMVYWMVHAYFVSSLQQEVCRTICEHSYDCTIKFYGIQDLNSKKLMCKLRFREWIIETNCNAWLTGMYRLPVSKIYDRKATVVVHCSSTIYCLSNCAKHCLYTCTNLDTRDITFVGIQFLMASAVFRTFQWQFADNWWRVAWKWTN